MALKGTTKIELTNVKTGEKEVIEKDNLVTNAVNDILTLNPYGVRFRNDTTGFVSNNNDASISYKVFGDQMLPICPNLFGGILLYEKTLEEDPDKYFADMDNLLVGYSSNVANLGVDTKRGSMNQTESGPLEDGTGYRFVFDFATSQANGTISSLGLTSKMGGVAGYGSTEDDFANLAYYIGSCEITPDFNSYQTAEKLSYANIVSLDVEKGEAIYAYVSAINTISLGKFRFPTGNLGLNFNYKKRFPVVPGSETIITTDSFASVFSTYGYFYGSLIDGGDGYIWGFQHEGNAEGNSTGSAKVLWIKISKEDWTFEEGTWTIDAQLYKLGHYTPVYENSNPNPTKQNNIIIKNGILYAIKYSSDSYMYGVYAIPLENPTNVTLMSTEDGYGRTRDTNWSYKYNYTSVNEVNGVIVYRGFYINDGKLIGTSALMNGNVQDQKCLFGCSKPGLKFGPYIFGISLYNDVRVVVYCYIQSCYLATINNLATPVEKTADKTMKITYILREE